MADFNTRITELFNKNKDLQDLKKSLNAGPLEAWLVGGTLRDLLLQRDVTDIDIATIDDPTKIAQAWARKIRGRWFWLDADRKQSRVLTADKLIVDFAPLRAATILEDLKLRDYTANALALPLSGDLDFSALLDPLSGQQDLQEGCLRLCSQQSLTDDPLRMLKGIRHATTLNLMLHDQSLQKIKEQAALITSVAGERLRDELGKILSSEKPVEGFRLLSATGLFQELFGPEKNSYNTEKTFIDLQQLIESIEEIEIKFDSETSSEDPFNSRALFLLATFLRSYASTDLSDLLHKKLRMSRQQERIVLSLQTGPGTHWFELVNSVKTTRQKALLVEQLGYFPDEQLLYWTVYKQHITLDKVRDLLRSFYEYQRLGRVPDLLSGHQLKELLYDQPDSEIGVWQQRIKRAEVGAAIVDQNDAFRWLKNEISI